MAYRDEEYTCKLCGQEIEVKKSGTGTLICCGKPMEKVEKEAA